MWCRRCCVYRRSEAFCRFTAFYLLPEPPWIVLVMTNTHQHDAHTHDITLTWMAISLFSEHPSHCSASELLHRWYDTALNVLYALRCEWKQVKRITSDISCLYWNRKCVRFFFCFMFELAKTGNDWHGDNSNAFRRQW